MVEQTSASGRIQPSDEGVINEQHKYQLDRQDRYLRTNVIDVFGKEAEPICDYLRCHHKFSEHGRSEYVNVNVNIHVTALLEHTFYCIIIDAG
jgi:hypothetical protein